jgi:cobalt-zinc-cadmium efflux system membrane fusion protein
MNIKLPLSILAVLALGGAAGYYINNSESSQVAGSSDPHAAALEEVKTVKGPNNGRILTDRGFTLELAIFEDDVPPEFRAWFSKAGRAIAPADVDLTVILFRPGDKKDVFNFAPIGDFSLGDLEVGEPHSFSYDIVAKHAGQTHKWAFDAPEMQTVIGADGAKAGGMLIAQAGPAVLDESLTVYGQVKLNADNIARATPRFGGIIREVRKSLGDTVKAGEVVAIVETNQSLVSMDVKTPIDGIIVERGATIGETVPDGEALYTIADLSNVWVDLNIPKNSQGFVKVGQQVSIKTDDGEEHGTGKIAWISPLGQAVDQTFIARIYMDNTNGRWKPGLFVKASIALGQSQVEVAVKESGIQILFDFTVVFSQHGELYQARPLELGRKSNGFVEVLKGIEAGESYVASNSFLVKADIGKSGASHDH